jgi:tetratricopeptide (TPR) repeat protein
MVTVKTTDFRDDVKAALIYYLYLALDTGSAKERTSHFQKLFEVRGNIEWLLMTLGLMESGEELPKDDDSLDRFTSERLKKPDILENYSIAFKDFSSVKNEIAETAEKIIAECNDDDRYERLVEHIDRLLDENPDEITGQASRKYLWVFVMFSISEGILTGEKKKFLKHFSRLAEIDKNILPEMEFTAQSLVELGRKRTLMKSSDESYSKVVKTLVELNSKEQDLQKNLNKLLGADNDADFDVLKEDDSYSEPPFVERLIEGVGYGIADILNGVADAIDDLSMIF